MNLKLRTLNSILNALCLLAIICGLWIIDCRPIYSQDDYLEVKGNIKTDSLDFDTFGGDTGGLPATPVEGELFYDFTTGVKQPQYYDGSAWQVFVGGGGTKTVATKIVAASNTDLAGTGRSADYICDGIDDQLKIQDAIDALPPYDPTTNTGGGAVYLLEGTYNLSGSINLDNGTSDGFNDSRKTIIGTGKGTVLRVMVDGSFNLIDATSVSHILISQLMISGNGKNSFNAIVFNSVTYSKIEKVWIETMNYWGWVIGLVNSSNNIILGSHLISNNGCGVVFSSSNNNIFSDNEMVNSSWNHSVTLGDSNNNTISNNSISGSGKCAIFFGCYCGTPSDPSNNNLILNNYLNSSWDTILCNGENNIISGNIISGGDYSGITISNSNNIVSNNSITLKGGRGISSSADNNVITANRTYNNGDAEIVIPWGAENNLISYNSTYDSSGSGYGIDITDFTSANNYIVGNFLDGVGSCKLINDLGANTKYTGKVKMTLEKKTVTSNFSPLDVATNPTTYVALQPSGAITLTLSDGKAPGDLLILENISTNSVTINDSGNINLELNLILGQYDTLELIWNGTVAEGGTGKWLQVKYVNNLL